MKRLRLLPVLIMLIAGLITSVIAVLKQFDPSDALTTLFFVLLSFYALGLVARAIITKVCFSEPIETSEEGELEEGSGDDDLVGEAQRDEEKS
jgi:hypothetical protein